MCLSPQVRVLDLDSSVAGRQHTLLSRLACQPNIQNLKTLGRQIRYLAPSARMRDLELQIDRSQRNCLTFIGSGDFHHVSAPLLRQFDKPISLVVFDTHPDWDRTSPWSCCGSWVLEALRMPNVQHIAMIGLGAVDITGWHVNVGPVREIRAGRVAFYPAEYPVSRTLWQPQAQSVPCADFMPRPGYTDICWRTLRGRDWKQFADRLITSLPTEAVYVSVDKDCLRPEDATTNWEEGALALDQVTSFIEWLRASKNIVGADITGEYSSIEVDNPFFRALSRADHPARPAITDAQLARNEQTNTALLEAFGIPFRAGHDAPTALHPQQITTLERKIS